MTSRALTGLDRAARRIGVDEKAFRKGHSYMTTVCDQDLRRIFHDPPPPEPPEGA